MPLDDARSARLRLALAAGPAAPRARLLEKFHRDATALLRANPSSLRQAGLDEAQISRLRLNTRESATRHQHACRWLEAPNHHLLLLGDADYPPLLAASAQPPFALFVAGEPGHLWQPQIAIVGSRNASIDGLENARHFAHTLAAQGFTITSGLAAGIDRAAHEGALDEGNALTLAVLGCGPDIAYPRSHHKLMQRICRQGALVSEYPPSTPPLKAHFPARNRIVAALAAGTLVVEAAERSGALITARLATEAGREVFALPGSIHNPMAAGCHRLLRQGANLVVQPEEITEQVRPILASLGQSLRQRLSITPSRQRSEPATQYRHLWQAIGHDPCSLDQLIARTGLTLAQISPQLLQLEIQGHIRQAQGRYCRVRG